MFIPIDIRQPARKYKFGEYVIHPIHEKNTLLKQWITSAQFTRHETHNERMQLHSRKRNNLYSFHLGLLNKDVVLKVSQISDDYRWYRKLNLRLVELFKNYSLNAYYGSIALQQIDIDSLNVVAHWTYRGPEQTIKSYLLYEKVNASMSVFDLCQAISEKNPRAGEITTCIAKSLAQTIRVLHANNIRHGDPHAGNFLLSSHTSKPAEISPDQVDDMKFTLIDLDKVHFSHRENSLRKKIFNIKCIRRFYVPNINSNQCLAYYLDREPKAYERFLLYFWMKGGLNIYKWLKPGKKRV